MIVSVVSDRLQPLSYPYTNANMPPPLTTSFGNFQGHQGDGVIQFQGIKFASLKDQLSVPEMVTTYGTKVVDATHFG